MQLDGRTRPPTATALFGPITRSLSGIALVVAVVFSSPGLGRAFVCPDNHHLDIPPILANPAPATQCVAPTVQPYNLAACTTNCLMFCPGFIHPAVPFFNSCSCTLDEAVNLQGPALGEALGFVPGRRVIAVFGPTVEAAANRTSVPPAYPAVDNVVVDRGLPPIFGPVPYPLQIEECHDARINAGVAALPVIDVLATSGNIPQNPSVGPVLINGLEVIGGSVGVLVRNSGSPQQPGTTLKAVRAETNGAAGGFSGQGFDIRGNLNLVNGCTAEFNSGGFLLAGNNNTVTNSNRALSNLLNGFTVTGAGNLVRGSIATGNGADGFNVPGTGNTLRDNRANKNLDDGFEIGAVGSIGGNRLKGNASNQGTPGGRNENGGCEYNILALTIDQGGNKADNFNIPNQIAPKCPNFPALALPPPKACMDPANPGFCE